MLIAAKYEGKESCLVNSDYIVDVFVENGKYIAYTIDPDRAGYEILLNDLTGIMEAEYENTEAETAETDNGEQSEKKRFPFLFAKK